MNADIRYRAKSNPSPGLLAFLLVFLCHAHGRAQPPGPQPPCGADPVPAWPGPDEPVVSRAWSRPEFGRDWKPPLCTGWSATGFTTLVTIAARFRHTTGADGLLRRIGAISELAGIRYWSNTHKQWRVLIPDACALPGMQGGRCRGGFTTSEMQAGKPLYFEQTNNLTGKGIYRMDVREASPDRLVVSVENVGAVRYLFLTVFHPREMQTVYFLDRESDEVWRFYSIVRTGINASGLVAVNESSTINRAVAFYRSLAGIPTAMEPPAAR